MAVKKIRAVIVDDEPLARERIRTLLAGERDFEIAAECRDGGEAIEAIESLNPDLLFLDVQMPEVDGFDVLLSCDVKRLPAVIFVTAFDRYAVRAFDVHALDYLLKPFDRARFVEALDRARQRIRQSEETGSRLELDELLADLRRERGDRARILVRSSDRIVVLSLDEVDWIEAAGNYMRLHVGSEIHLLRETMSGMESRLPPDRFVRIHRSTMVQVERIKELVQMFNNEFLVVLQNGEKLKLSRTYRPELERRLGKPL